MFSMLTKEAREKMGWRKDRIFTAYIKTCGVCGNEFKTVPTSKKQFTCSHECAAKRKIKMADIKIVLVRKIN